MKKLLNTVLIIIITFTIASVALMPEQANASWYCIFAPGACIASAGMALILNSFLADLGQIILSVFAGILSIAGLVLNVSIILSMNIKAIYEATPAIEDLWIITRNLSSIFIIFALIYTSIATILGVGSTGIKKLISNIILAGLLINFSLFFTKVLIDGSNLISLQFYRAIAPESQTASITKDTIGDVLTKSFTDGGISNVFMHGLKIPKIYGNKKGLFEVQGTEYFKIILSTLIGSILMLFAALSFFAAALMFIIRLVILLLLMGFSPVYFAGMIFPDIKKDMSDKWAEYLKQQLIFMPVYLFFMYFALRFISTINASTGAEEGFFSALDNAQTKASKSGTSGIMLSVVGLCLQYTIAFILINIPLIAAIKTGGSKWSENFTKKAGKTIGGFIGQHSVGRAAKLAGDKVATSKWARSMPNLATFANKNLAKVSGASFGGSAKGYDQRFKKYSEERNNFVTKRIGLSADKEEDIEEKTGGKLAKDLVEQLAVRDKVMNEKQEELYSKNLSVLAQEKQTELHNDNISDIENGYNNQISALNNRIAEMENEHNNKVSTHNNKISEIEKEYNSHVDTFGSGTPLATNTKAKLDQARTNLAAENAAFKNNAAKAQSDITSAKTRFRNDNTEAQANLATAKAALIKTNREAASAKEEADKAKTERDNLYKSIEAKVEHDKTIKAGGIVSEKIKEEMKSVSDIEEAIRVSIREEKRKAVSEQMAKDLDRDWNPFTREASKVAANEIRKQNSKKREQLDMEKMFKQAFEDNKPKDDKPKDSK